MLEQKNSRAILKSSSIKLIWDNGFINFSFKFQTHNNGQLECIRKQLVAIKLVQNTSIHNKRKKIHNYLKNVPCKKKWHFAIDSNDILSITTKNNNNFELQSLLKDNDFVSKFVNYIYSCYVCICN
jgi:hypothetical protein